MMDQLRQQIAAAQNRLVVQQFITVAVWSLFVTLLIAAVAISVPKIWFVPLDVGIWASSWLGGAIAVGLLAAVTVTYFVHRSALDAAIEIDRRFGLKERVSSTLSLEPDDLQTEMGRALIDDARRRVERIDVPDRFPVRGHWTIVLPLFPAAAVFVLMLVGNAAPDAERQAGASPIAAKKQIKNSAEQLKQKLAERRKKAQQSELKDAEDLFKRLEAGVGEMSKKEETDPKRAMAKLNDLADELKKRRQELESREEIRSQLSSLKNIKSGPADKMAQAIKDGNFAKALDEIKNLQSQLQDGKLTDQQRAALADQLGQMAKKMQQMTDAHQQAKRDLQREIERREKEGDTVGAGLLQRKLDRMNMQDPKMQRLRQMANQLGQCAQGARAGNGQMAAQNLDELAADLEQMIDELEELEMLEDVMDQIGMAKDSMQCQNCNGLGCGMCQGMGVGDKPGMGMGQGKGKGDRPENETDTSFYQSQVRAKVGRGKAVVVDSVPGKNIAGQAREEIKTAIESAVNSSDDPLVGQRIPRQHRDQVDQYFEAFRKGGN